MILSGRDLRWYVDTGKLVIHPVTPEQFQQNGVDFILEDVDNQWGVFAKFQLGTTREWIEMPDDLMAFVELRSTWARRGLIIPPTIVDAGFKGNITLEICAFHEDVRVPYGERFAHLVFARTSSPCEPYRGKYQGQMGITRAKEDPRIK